MEHAKQDPLLLPRTEHPKISDILRNVETELRNEDAANPTLADLIDNFQSLLHDQQKEQYAALNTIISKLRSISNQLSK